MGRTGIFETVFAAAFASVMGLGAGGAAALDHGPDTYRAEPSGGAALPAWLVRHKLRQQGYQDIEAVRAADDGFIVDARDQWGRRVRLLVDRSTGEILAQPGFGMAHLGVADVAALVEQQGMALCSRIVRCADRYEMKALDGQGALRDVHVDPLTGAMWF
jgi:hypothetical protein